MKKVSVPFFRVELQDEEIREVVETLKSGWLTTGPRVKRFEKLFAEKVGAKYAVAVNSCTAALHLALEAMNLRPGQAVLVPSMTFAATAEVVRYFSAIPILVDSDPDTLNMDLTDARRKISEMKAGVLSQIVPLNAEIVGMIPVHVGGFMMDMEAVRAFAEEHGLWVVEDAAHALPAGWRKDNSADFQLCGSGGSDIACFSFYANKTITTGEGGMATTDKQEIADRLRLMSLHGLSRDAWSRYSGGGTWDYRIVAPGFKYNMTDIAAAIGIHQLERAESMRRQRESIADIYYRELGDNPWLSLPLRSPNRLHSWHLFPIRLNLEKLKVNRNAFVDALRDEGIGFSVHWRPLHMHPYYRDIGWQPEQFPVASREWERLVSLPFFHGLRQDEIDTVVATLHTLTQKFGK